MKLQISQTLEKRLEAAVGVMLVILGLNALRRLLKAGRIHVHTHDHDGRRHIHIHTHGDPTSEPSHHRFSTRSMAVGMVHGLAGSAALMLLLVPAIPTPAVAILYILVFGVGSICGMMAMSFLMSLPFHFTASRSMGLNVAIRLCAGVFSLSLGAAIVYDKIG